MFIQVHLVFSELTLTGYMKAEDQCLEIYIIVTLTEHQDCSSLGIAKLRGNFDLSEIRRVRTHVYACALRERERKGRVEHLHKK